jgi:hypothetical protein
VWEQWKELMSRMSWKDFRNTVYTYDRPALDRKCNAVTLADSGCLSYGTIDEKFVQKHQLERVQIPPMDIDGYDGPRGYKITEVAKFVLDESAGEEHIAMLYIVQHIAHYDMILGLSYPGWFTVGYTLTPMENKGHS